MKKLITFLLVALYSFSVMGTTIAFHYCMGDKIGASLGYNDQVVCEACPVKKHTTAGKDNCCKDNNQFLKVTSAQDISVMNFVVKAPVSFVSFSYTLSEDLLHANSGYSLIGDRIDPPDNQIYQRNCNFRI